MLAAFRQCVRIPTPRGCRNWDLESEVAGHNRGMVLRAPDDVVVCLRRARDHADRHFAQPLRLDQLAAIAGISKYHFQRLFVATYGMSPAEYLSRRRIERAQDLLRATNLTVTEICVAVGFSSLGSFSSRFTDLVGESPSQFRQRYSDGAPRIPGCYLFMAGLAERYPASGSDS